MNKLGSKLGVRKKVIKKVEKWLKIKKRCFAYKTLNFCLIFIILGSLKAELSENFDNMSKFCLSPIRAAQS